MNPIKWAPFFALSAHNKLTEFFICGFNKDESEPSAAIIVYNQKPADNDTIDIYHPAVMVAYYGAYRSLFFDNSAEWCAAGRSHGDNWFFTSDGALLDVFDNNIVRYPTIGI